MARKWQNLFRMSVLQVGDYADATMEDLAPKIEKRWNVPPILGAHLLLGCMTGAADSAERELEIRSDNPDYDFEVWRARKAGEFARLFVMEDLEQMSAVIDEINAEQTKRFGEVSEQERNIGNAEYRDRVAVQKGELPDDC